MHVNDLELVRRANDRALVMQHSGASRREILTVLAAAGEAIAGEGCVVSILLLDEQGLLRNGASPNLAPDYLDAIDRLKPHPDLGTCASAAATGHVVLTPDFRADDKWAELRHLPMALGFVGAWSQPILDDQGRVLGTFGTYYRQVREPTERERASVKALAGTAARILSSSRESTAA